VLLAGELLLDHEGVFVEPFEQVFAEGGHHLRLRIVDVGIDEPRGNDCVLVMSHFGAGGKAWSKLVCRPDVGDLAVREHDQRIALVNQALLGILQEGIAAEGDDVTTDGMRAHDSVLL